MPGDPGDMAVLVSKGVRVTDASYDARTGRPVEEIPTSTAAHGTLP